MKKSLLIVSGGIEALQGIEIAKKMGLHVVVSDGSAEAPGFALADDRLIVSTYDVGATVKAAVEYHKNVRRIDGVICIASDVSLTVASVAKALSLPGIPISAALFSSDKLAAKKYFASTGIPIPWFSALTSSKQLNSFLRKHPALVIKPVDSRGARGVQLLTPGMDLEAAFNEAMKHSPSRQLIAEAFLPGPQISTESLVINGKCHTIGFADRNYEYLERFSPCVIENGGDLPANLSEREKESINELISNVAECVGVRNGVLKGDIVMYEGKPHVIEVALRISGGFFATHEIPLCTGVNFVQLAIQICLGEPIEEKELTPKFQRGVSQRFVFPKPGIVTKIEGVAEVEKLPWISLCQIRVREGDLVRPTTSHPDRVGLVVATGETNAQARLRAQEALEIIKIETRY